MTRMLRFASIATFAFTLAGSAAAAPAVTAVRCGRLIDVKSGTAVANAVVLVEKGKVTAAGAGVKVPEGAKTIDLGQSTCLPGLIDSHTHLLSNLQSGLGDQQGAAMMMYTQMSLAQRALLGAAMAREMLEAGFTAVRDLGNSGVNGDVALRDAIRDGWVQGPRMVVSTRALSPIGGQFRRLSPQGAELVALDYVQVTSPEEGRRAVRQALFDGADVIKVIVNEGGGTFSLDDLKAIVDEAHRAHRKVAAHAMAGDSIGLSIDAGVDSIEHGYFVTDDLLRRMAEKKIYLVPTDFTVDDFEAVVRRPGATAEDEKAIRERLEKMSAGVHDRLARAVKLGVPIAAGSDAYYALPGKTRGQAALDMLHPYVDAGLKPVDVLRAVTMNAADLLGLQDRIGTLEPGHYADLIAVPGDPLADVFQLEKVTFVMKGGAVVRDDTPHPR
ncbi:MAG TPA: amidohydrolase family protein [Thermoanaerobaculia bacterium]|nr:amidohydrolase family protein [Thermoanaerobaculia bacterium]